MPRDVQIMGGIGAAPQSYTVPNATEIIPKAINATFNGAATAQAWVPTVEIVSDGGVVIARCPCSTTVIAGGSAECSFYPFNDEPTSTAAAFSALVPTIAPANTLRAWWRLGEAAAPFADSSGWSGGPTPLTVAGAGPAPTTAVPGALGGGQDDGAIQLNGAPATGEYLAGGGGALNNGINSGVSIMAWVKPFASASNWLAAVYNNIAFSAGNWNGWALTIVWSGGNTFAYWRRIITSAVVAASAPISADTWTFLVSTYDGATLRLYVNGLLAASAADARADTFASYSSPDVGISFSDPFPPVGTVSGVLDEIAIWGTVLSLAQIQELYAASF